MVMKLHRAGLAMGTPAKGLCGLYCTKLSHSPGYRSQYRQRRHIWIAFLHVTLHYALCMFRSLTLSTLECLSSGED